MKLATILKGKKIQLLFPVILFFLCTASMQQLNAQYSIWSFKAGPSLGFQRWNSVGSTQPLLGLHGSVAVESYEPGKPFAFFAELAYHQRGSSQRVNGGQTQNGVNYDGFTIKNRFHNLSFALGGRKSFGPDFRYFYSLDLRAEYTLDYELSNYFQGFDDFVRKFNYGLDVGGGINIPLGFHMGFIDLQLQPDLSRQIFSLRFAGQDYQGNNIIYPEQKVVNYSLELSVGIRINGNLDAE